MARRTATDPKCPCSEMRTVGPHDGGSTVAIGDGAVILPTAVTTDEGVGEHVRLNETVTVRHDERVGRASVANPGASVSGGVDVGSGRLARAGAVIKDTLHSGHGTRVGVGADVAESVPAAAGEVDVSSRLVGGA